uniref:Uncharacterized protein n=1 Tax=Candidatus Kentrum sp. LPFa TaxID=2126335 RepID=A0A450X7G3_9GAMM|nr:MAG: hypothetical protein BECKLPF1236B_GA0070989_14651 [Candidatus Kentron sp. LPFa]VFK25587.1 MAG: hypothetical protein BECKLPF1236B_GA0070989_14981 [Candidatus Kentron sp. LPFa]
MLHHLKNLGTHQRPQDMTNRRHLPNSRLPGPVVVGRPSTLVTTLPVGEFEQVVLYRLRLSH